MRATASTAGHAADRVKPGAGTRFLFGNHVIVGGDWADAKLACVRALEPQPGAACASIRSSCVSTEPWTLSDRVADLRLARQFGERVEIPPPYAEPFEHLRRVDSKRIDPLGVREQAQPEMPGHLFHELRQTIGRRGPQALGIGAQSPGRMTGEAKRPQVPGIVRSTWRERNNPLYLRTAHRDPLRPPRHTRGSDTRRVPRSSASDRRAVRRA